MKQWPWIALLAVTLTGCAKERMDDCFTSMGEPAVEERTVPDIRVIKLTDRVDLEITQDSLAGSPTVVVVAGRNILPAVITEVRDGTLHIGNAMRCNWVRRIGERPLVRVRMRALDELVYSGVGDVRATTPITGRTFRLEQWEGQGTVRLHLEVDTCWIGLHTGVGDAVISGRTHTAHLYTLNFAHINACALQARQVLVNHSGSGDIRCRAVDAAYVQVRSVGDLYVGDTPEVLDVVRTGKGRLITAADPCR